MKLDLEKGMVLDLSKDNQQLTNILLWVDWWKIETKWFFWKSLKDVDLDLSVTLLDDNKNEIDTIYYGKLSAQWIKHAWDDLEWDDEADDSDNEQISIDLKSINSNTKYIVAHLVSYSWDELDKLPYATARVYDHSNNDDKLAEFKLTELWEFKGKKGVLLWVFYKDNSEWKFKALGTPLNERDPKKVASWLDNWSIEFNI